MADPSVTSGAARPIARRPRRGLVALGVVGVVVALLAGVLFLAPSGTAIPGRTDPAASFEEATERIGSIAAAEAADPSILPACRSRLYDHGGPTAAVVVLFHGYTNCPKQYDRLAEALAERGLTVWVPRAPHHGLDPATPGVLGSLAVEDLVAYADGATDVAQGLGERVAVFGLSGGGVIASYLAQVRDDVDLAVPAAAFLTLPWATDWMTPPLVNALGLAPALDARDPAPDEAIRGAFPQGASDTSTHGAVAYMRLGQAVLAGAASGPPAAGRIIVVNDADTVVNNALVEVLEGRWRAARPDGVSLYRFDRSMDILHDMITPDRDGERIDVVYPVLLELLGATPG